MKIAVPRETAEGETRVALTPQTAGQLRRRRRGGHRAARSGCSLVHPRRGVDGGRCHARPRCAGAVRPGRHGASRRSAHGRGDRHAPCGDDPHRHTRHAGPPRVRAASGRVGRDRHQHGRDPSHHARPEHGHPLEPGDGRRLQGGADRRGAPAEVHAVADDGRRDGATGSCPGLRRGSRRADGDRDREATRRRGGGDRRATGRQGAGRLAGWHLPRGRDDRRGEGAGGNVGRLRA